MESEPSPQKSRAVKSGGQTLLFKEQRNFPAAAGVCQCYFLLYGLVVTPYLALLPEIASSPSVRLNLTTGQGIATLVGTLLFALSGFIIQKFGYPVLGFVLAIAVLFSFYPTTLVISEPSHSEHSKGSLSGGNVDYAPLHYYQLAWFLSLQLVRQKNW
jgi:Na+/melibiose symporter-like transporter